MNHLNASQIQIIAQLLYMAQQNKQTIAQLKEQYPNLSVGDAYKIQDCLIQLQQKKGRTLMGYKMGLTNHTKMQTMGVTEPLMGYLFHDMLHSTSIEYDKLIQPRVEMEIAFILAHDLSGANITLDDVIAATSYITPALEIVDSRYHDFKFAFADGIADNICAAGVVLGTNKIHPRDINLADVNVSLTINNSEVATGNTNAVLANPLNSVAMLANMLAKNGHTLTKGSVIISGAITDAVRFKRGDQIKASFEGLGNVITTIV